MKRILALLLTVIMMFGAFAIDISAHLAPSYKDDTANPGDSGEPEKELEIDWEATLAQYLEHEFKSEQDKLATMTMMYEKDGYQLYVDEYTGEVATVNVKTGQILFSNPYDIASTSSSESIKGELFSQIIVKYTDNDQDKTMNSFKEAASRGQIKFKYIKNGIRVEYSIGREETRTLVPRWIEKTRFEDLILTPFADEINKISRENADKGYVELNWRDYIPMAMRTKMIQNSGGNNEWFKFVKLLAFYSKKSLAEAETKKEEESMKALYPAVKKMDLWTCTPDISRNELITIEGYIKTFVPSYTFEQLDQDHLLTEYAGQDKAPPLFKMALEYTLDEKGMSVRLPANGLRFDESLYQLVYVSILPYMGAGANYLLGDEEETFTGYNFFPDGSGTLFRHEELAKKASTVVNGKVYGQDFAYNTIVGANQQIIRYPVFGIVSNTHRTVQVKEQVQLTEEIVDPDGNTIIVDSAGKVYTEHQFEETTVDKVVEEDKGFVAIIEEGDALAELSDYHMGSTGKYNTVQMLFYPRPKDSYNLANAISVGANATWTVVSSRKYVGNYKIRYIMLTDDEVAEDKQVDKYYECSWMGMAEAYRDYLYDKGELESLTAEDVKEDIPMYIETLGTLETLEKILSVPVNVMTSLTSFENVKTMYDELSAEGVKNIKFKLTGYANGGLYSAVPYKLEWEKSVGGDDGFEDLLAYSAEKGFEVFPEFDFAYVSSGSNTLFDGLTLKKHIVKSINDTYMSRRYYSATRQTHVGRFELAISAAYFSHFYDKLTENLFKNYEGIDALKSISVSTLGTDLNSDFDEEEPYNREDSKTYTQMLFEKMDQDYDLIMTEGANAYTWKYVDYIINVPLDSSRYNMSANAVPFIGVVLHGSVEFAGTPLNMEGNIGYSMLKAIENGAGLYFILAYENYEELKNDFTLQEYYSVRYDILKNDVIKYYTIINDLTKDLQLSKIVGHKFLIGERVPDEDEVEADKEQLKKEEEAAAKLEAELAAKELQEALLEGRVYAASIAKSASEEINKLYKDISGYHQGSVTVNDESGVVSVRIGMATLIKTALAKADAKDPLEDAYLLANAWDRAYKGFNQFVFSGTNKVRHDLEIALEGIMSTYESALADVIAKEEAYEEAIKKAVTDKLNSIPKLVDNYNKAIEARDAIADTASSEYATMQKMVDDALAAITAFVTSLDDAKTYAELYAAQDEAKLAMDRFVSELKTANTNANKAYTDKQSAIAATLAENADYIAKSADVKAADNKVKTIEIILSNLNAQLATYAPSYPDTPEHKAILSTITEYEAKLVDAKAAYKEAVNALDAVYAAADAEFAAIKLAADTAADAFLNYETNADYVALKAAYDSKKQPADALAATLEANINGIYSKLSEDYSNLLIAQNQLAAKIEEMKEKAYNDAEYAKLLADVEAKEAAITALNEGYLNDATYKDLVEKLTAPIDTKIAELVSQISSSTPEQQIKLAAEITSLLSVKYQKVTTPKNYNAVGFNILLEVDKNVDGYIIGAGYILNDFISKYEASVKSSEAFKTADAALTEANKALKDYSDEKIKALENDAAYKALVADKTAADNAVKDFVLDNKGLKDAASQLVSSNASAERFKADVDSTKAELDATPAYTGVDSYVKVIECLDAALAQNPDIIAQYEKANSEYGTALGYVKSHIDSINRLFKNLDAQADVINTALKNSNTAKDYYNQKASDYSQEFLAALEAVFTETRDCTKAANQIIDLSMAEINAALKLAKDIIPGTESDLELEAIRVEVKDDGTVVVPAETDEPEEEEEEEEEEEKEPEYEYTKYTDDSGNIAYVEYDNGTFFILNYNDYDVTVVFEGVTYTLGVYGGVKVTNGTPQYFKATEIN